MASIVGENPNLVTYITHGENQIATKSDLTDGETNIDCNQMIINGDCKVTGNISAANYDSKAVVTSVGTPIAATDNNGVTVSSNTLKCEYADATHNGIVSTSGQTFAGTKTFSDVVITNSINAPCPDHSYSLFLNHSVASDLVNYRNADFTISAATAQNINYSIIVGDGTKLLVSAAGSTEAKFATALKNPNLTKLSQGIYESHIFASVDDDTAATNILFKIYRDINGTPSLLATSSSMLLTTSLLANVATVAIPDTNYVPSQDRIIIELWAQTTSITTRTITIQYEGSNNYSFIYTPISTFVPTNLTSLNVSGDTICKGNIYMAKYNTFLGPSGDFNTYYSNQFYQDGYDKFHTIMGGSYDSTNFRSGSTYPVFSVSKANSVLSFNYATSAAANSIIAPVSAISIDSTGNVTIPALTATSLTVGTSGCSISSDVKVYAGASTVATIGTSGYLSCGAMGVKGTFHMLDSNSNSFCSITTSGALNCETCQVNTLTAGGDHTYNHVLRGNFSQYSDDGKTTYCTISSSGAITTTSSISCTSGTLSCGNATIGSSTSSAHIIKGSLTQQSTDGKTNYVTIGNDGTLTTSAGINCYNNISAIGTLLSGGSISCTGSATTGALSCGVINSGTNSISCGSIASSVAASNSTIVSTMYNSALSNGYAHGLQIGYNGNAHNAARIAFNSTADGSTSNSLSFNVASPTISDITIDSSGVTTFNNTTASSAYNNGSVVLSGGLGLAGRISTNSGIMLPTGNTLLSVYEEVDFGPTKYKSGTNVSSSDVTLKLRRVGKLCSIIFPYTFVTGGGTGVYTVTVKDALPAGYYSNTYTIGGPIRTYINGSVNSGYWYVGTDGILVSEYDSVVRSGNCSFFAQYGGGIVTYAID
jgi:hypothetical protein